MKKDYSLLVASLVTTVSYVLFLVGISAENLIGVASIGLIGYIIGIILSLVFTIKLSKNKTDNITALTIITIMLFVSFFPIGIYWMWAKTKWNKKLKIALSIIIPIAAVAVFIAPFNSDSSSVPESAETITTVESTTQVTTTTEAATETTTETTTEATTEATTEETTKYITTTQQSERIVYITPTGSKWHSDKSCAGKNAIEQKYDDVKNSYGPCKKCAEF